ncbi:MAG: tetratricopeptide repeat protein [Cyanobacteria bacterium HKST-UBA02]|nr:tetratricopeptide repeat protein [Cyanobacteria bacterium HKST-UBA02]
MTEHTHSNDSCCCSAEATNRRFADSLRQKAQEFLNAEGRPVAEALLTAARAMLVANGGITGEAGVYLLIAEAHLPLLDDDQRTVLWHFEEALRIAEESLPANHMALGICLSNTGETNLKLGDAEQAAADYQRAFPIIEKALEEAEEDHMQSYLARVLAEIVSGSKEAARALTQSGSGDSSTGE